MIDPGERWAAVLGVECVLTKKVERITNATKKKAVDLEKTIFNLATELCQGKLKAKWPRIPDFAKIGDQLTESIKAPQLQAMISQLPVDIQMQYQALAAKQFQFLQKAYPRPSRVTLSGPIPIEPSSVEVFRFQGIFRVINDPTYVILLASSGALLRNQAQACRLIFPTVSALIDEAIRQAIENESTKAKLSGKNYEVPYEADVGIKDWRGNPINIKPYQLAYLKGKQPINAEPNPSTAMVSVDSKSSLSAAQSALYQNAKGA